MFKTWSLATAILLLFNVCAFAQVTVDLAEVLARVKRAEQTAREEAARTKRTAYLLQRAVNPPTETQTYYFVAAADNSDESPTEAEGVTEADGQPLDFGAIRVKVKVVDDDVVEAIVETPVGTATCTFPVTDLSLSKPPVVDKTARSVSDGDVLPGEKSIKLKTASGDVPVKVNVRSKNQVTVDVIGPANDKRAVAAITRDGDVLKANMIPGEVETLAVEEPAGPHDEAPVEPTDDDKATVAKELEKTIGRIVEQKLAEMPNETLDKLAEKIAAKLKVEPDKSPAKKAEKKKKNAKEGKKATAKKKDASACCYYRCGCFCPIRRLIWCFRGWRCG